MRLRFHGLAIRVATGGMVALGLTGCVEDFAAISVSQGDIRTAIAKGTLTSPRPATVAMTSLEGAPPAVASRFEEAFRKAAADREITVAAADTAHYLVRGYLSATPADAGTALSYVYDIFDANDRRRVDRVTDVLTVPGSGADAWALVDDKALASLSGRSADDLAVALAGTPEAHAGAAVVAAAPATLPH